jgi:hypothetical protein
MMRAPLRQTTVTLGEMSRPIAGRALSVGAGLLAAAFIVAPASAAPDRADARAFVAADTVARQAMAAVQGAVANPPCDAPRGMNVASSAQQALLLQVVLFATLQRESPVARRYADALTARQARDPVLRAYVDAFTSTVLPLVERFGAGRPFELCAVLRHWRAARYAGDFDWLTDARVSPSLARTFGRLMRSSTALEVPESLRSRVRMRLLALGIPRAQAEAFARG